MVTFVDRKAVSQKEHPGHSFIIAGFRPVGLTKRRKLVALQMRPEKMPPSRPALGMQRGMGLVA